MSGKSKAPYLPNNWKRYKAAPDEMFETHSFIEIMTWKIASWELPADVYCLIRATNLKNSKVKEYMYKRSHAAEAKIESLLDKETHELTICTHDAIHYSHPLKHHESDYI